MAIVAPAAPCATIDPDRLRQAFRLTAAEARLLTALVTGERLADYAERTGVKRSTAKTHLRGLFHKVGESRQADLIRLEGWPSLQPLARGPRFRAMFAEIEARNRQGRDAVLAKPRS